MPVSWTRQPQRFFQHLLREQDADGLDPADLVEEALSVGATATIAMGGGFSAWYPTKRSSQTVNPHMRGDFLGAYLDASQRAGLRTLVRMDLSKARSFEPARADWYVRNAEGEVASVWAMPQICATGSFWQEENFAIVDEILCAYRPDGFFYNYFHVARCWCERCRRLVRAETGADVPAPGERRPAYEAWRAATLARYTARLRDFIRARSQDVALVPYHHVRDGWDMRAMAAVSDIVGAQISNPVVPNPVDPQPVWSHWTTEEALVARALKPDVAPLLIQTTSEFFASRQTAMPGGRLVRNMAEAIAHRGVPAAAVNGRLQGDDARFVPVLKTFGAFQVKNASWYEGLESLARIAVLRSPASLHWGPDAGRLGGDDAKPGHVAEFRGVVQMLAAARRPFDVLIGGGLGAGELARYDLVILPAVSCLSDADADVLDAYAAGGGRLVATADTGACDEAGMPRDACALKALGSLPGDARGVDGAYLRLAADDLRAAAGGAVHVGIAGAFWTPRTEVVGDLRLIGPFANNAPEFTVVPQEGREPGLLDKDLGQGGSVWLPWRIGALFVRHGVPEYGVLLEALVARVAGEPQLRSDAPRAVDFALQRHPQGLLLHLLNSASCPSGPRIETAALAGFEVAVRCTATDATLLNTGEPLAARRRGEDLVISIDRLDTFAAVALTG